MSSLVFTNAAIDGDCASLSAMPCFFFSSLLFFSCLPVRSCVCLYVWDNPSLSYSSFCLSHRIWNHLSLISFLCHCLFCSFFFLPLSFILSLTCTDMCAPSITFLDLLHILLFLLWEVLRWYHFLLNLKKNYFCLSESLHGQVWGDCTHWPWARVVCMYTMSVWRDEWIDTWRNGCMPTHLPKLTFNILIPLSRLV